MDKDNLLRVSYLFLAVVEYEKEIIRWKIDKHWLDFA